MQRGFNYSQKLFKSPTSTRLVTSVGNVFVCICNTCVRDTSFRPGVFRRHRRTINVRRAFQSRRPDVRVRSTLGYVAGSARCSRTRTKGSPVTIRARLTKNTSRRRRGSPCGAHPRRRHPRADALDFDITLASVVPSSSRLASAHRRPGADHARRTRKRWSTRAAFCRGCN